MSYSFEQNTEMIKAVITNNHKLFIDAVRNNQSVYEPPKILRYASDKKLNRMIKFVNILDEKCFSRQQIAGYLTTIRISDEMLSIIEAMDSVNVPQFLESLIPTTDRLRG